MALFTYGSPDSVRPKNKTRAMMPPTTAPQVHPERPIPIGNPEAMAMTASGTGNSKASMMVFKIASEQ